MSEINVAAIVNPKPEKFDEVAALFSELVKKVEECEPDTLIYYVIKIQDKNELVVVERYKNEAAVKAHSSAPYFKETIAKAMPLLAKPVDIKMGQFLNGERGVSRL
ncbi:hypothetical protein F1880_010156 [Penicillium rolfsii]|nr:hypothetical protein F1880_010156 [Penicillium rolfsii]